MSAKVNLGSTARETAYNIIRDKIFFLDLKPGEALSDKLLAEELNMSRTPVREALIILATADMVVVKPQAGTFVAPIDVKRVEVEQLSRYAMEKEIVQRACNRMTHDYERQYEKNIEEYNTQEAGEDAQRIRKLMELDNEFHKIAFLAAGRERNFYHMTDYMQHIERLRVLSVLNHRPELGIDHAEIYKSIKKGDRIGAMYWLDCHLNRYIESLDEVKRQYPEYFEIG